MGFSCGCIGLPNVGKSTLFNILIKKAVAEASNYAFCTIEPNKGMVAVPDDRLNVLAKIENSQKIIAPTLTCVDIAGLVKGASEGNGLGNQFLGHVRQVDVIMHVVRCFEMDDIMHVENRIDPVEDVKLIETELMLSDMEILDRWMKKKDKDKCTKEIEWAKEADKYLSDGQYLSSLNFSEDMKNWLKKIGMITVLPKFYVANISDDNIENNEHLKNLRKCFSNDKVIAVCAKLEEDLINASADDTKEMLQEFGIAENGLDNVLRTGYDLLDLHTYFTVGKKETRGWTIQKNTKAPDAAGVIHEDFKRGFISADVISYDDFIKCGGYTNAKLEGKIRQEGRNYILNDGDVCNFKFNV